MADELDDYRYLYMCEMGHTKFVDAERVRKEKGKVFIKKNTKAIQPRIRVQLLDCRSGKEIKYAPVEGIRIAYGGKEYNYRRFRANSADMGWDLSKLERLPIYKVGSEWAQSVGKAPFREYPEKFTAQLALRGFGYYSDKITKDFDFASRRAYLKYLVDHGLITVTDPHGPQGDPEEEEAPPNAALELLMEILDDDPIPEKRWKEISEALFSTKDGKVILSPEYEALITSGTKPVVVVPGEAERKSLRNAFNARCYRAIEFHLASQGFRPETDKSLADLAMDETDDWKWDPWIKPFEEWQKIALNRQEGIKTQLVSTDDGKKLMQLAETWGFGCTDHKGMVYIPIPTTQFDKEFSIQVKFADLVIAKEVVLKELNGKKNGEGIIYRAENAIKATKFSVEWVDEQSETHNDWDQPWGWRLGPKLSEGEKEREGFIQFRTTGKFFIDKATDDVKKATKPGSDGKKKDLLAALHEKFGTFSKFYDTEKLSQPEFVVFALVWCQPVWDGIKNPKTVEPGSISMQAYIQSETELISNMHVTTRHKLSNSRGKKYSFCCKKTPESGCFRGKNHRGIDLFSLDGKGSAYAVHAGTVTNIPFYKTDKGDGRAGKKVRLVFPEEEFGACEYCHMHDDAGSLHDKRVKAGTKIGVPGRTGNLGWLWRKNEDDPTDSKYVNANTVWPSHVHLNGGAKGEGMQLRSENFKADDPNRFCIPSNQTPLIFPCMGEEEVWKGTLTECQFRRREGAWHNQEMVQTCWAAYELRCPYMLDDGDKREILRVQAQLRWLFEKDNADGKYTDPGPLTGDYGDKVEVGGHIKLKKGERLKLLKELPGATNPRLVETGSIQGVISRDVMSYKAPYYTLKADLEADLDLYATDLRKAIYNLRKAQGKLVSPESEPEKKPSNYEIDGLVGILNQKAKIAKPEK